MTSAPLSKQLGKYEILEEVGSGGFGTVYKARDTTLNRTVALKVLHAHLLHDRTFVERFQREAQTAANLYHPGIVPIHEIGNIEGVYFIAMRFLEGQSLEKLLRDQGGLPIERTAAILSQVAAALDFAHGQGVVHRDIKPSNMIISPDGTATLTDFGLARATGQSGLTSASQVLGTPYYMAPEMLDEEREKKLDYRADLYSLGVVVYQMVTGRLPFGGSTSAVIAGHLYKEPPKPSQVDPAIPPQLEDILLHALAKDPSQRFSQAGEMAGALAEFAQQHAAELARQRRIVDLPAGIQSALEGRDWRKAQDLCQELLTLVPDHPDATAWSNRAQEEIAQEEKRAAVEEELAASYDKALAFRDTGDLTQAAAVLVELLGQDSGFRDARAVLDSTRAEWEAKRLERSTAADQAYERMARVVQGLEEDLQALEQTAFGYEDRAHLTTSLTSGWIERLEKLSASAPPPVEEPEVPCPQCGIKNRSDSRFCALCRSTLPDATRAGRACRSCGARLRNAATLCWQCGSTKQAKSDKPPTADDERPPRAATGKSPTASVQGPPSLSSFLWIIVGLFALLCILHMCGATMRGY